MQTTGMKSRRPLRAGWGGAFALNGGERPSPPWPLCWWSEVYVSPLLGPVATPGRLDRWVEVLIRPGRGNASSVCSVVSKPLVWVRFPARAAEGHRGGSRDALLRCAPCAPWPEGETQSARARSEGKEARTRVRGQDDEPVPPAAARPPAGAAAGLLDGGVAGGVWRGQPAQPVAEWHCDAASP